MSNNTENFESLRQLLALKRHEQPPPGYFNSFSSQVITRIKLGELGEERTTTGGMIWEAAWLQKIWAAFEARPVFAGTFALAVCGFLIAGVIYSEKTDVQPVAFIPAIETTTGPVEVANASALMTSANHPLLAKPSALETPSTSPILGGLHAQPVSLTFLGGN